MLLPVQYEAATARSLAGGFEPGGCRGRNSLRRGQPEEVSIAGLARFNSGGYGYGNLVKVSGVVTLQKPDGTAFHPE